MKMVLTSTIIIMMKASQHVTNLKSSEKAIQFVKVFSFELLQFRCAMLVRRISTNICVLKRYSVSDVFFITTLFHYQSTYPVGTTMMLLLL